MKQPEAVSDAILWLLRQDPERKPLLLTEMVARLNISETRVGEARARLVSDHRLYSVQSDRGPKNQRLYGLWADRPKVKKNEVQPVVSRADPICGSRMPTGSQSYWSKYTERMNSNRVTL